MEVCSIRFFLRTQNPKKIPSRIVPSNQLQQAKLKPTEVPINLLVILQDRRVHHDKLVKLWTTWGVGDVVSWALRLKHCQLSDTTRKTRLANGPTCFLEGEIEGVCWEPDEGKESEQILASGWRDILNAIARLWFCGLFGAQTLIRHSIYLFSCELGFGWVPTRIWFTDTGSIRGARISGNIQIHGCVQCVVSGEEKPRMRWLWSRWNQNCRAFLDCRWASGDGGDESTEPKTKRLGDKKIQCHESSLMDVGFRFAGYFYEPWRGRTQRSGESATFDAWNLKMIYRKLDWFAKKYPFPFLDRLQFLAVKL